MESMKSVGIVVVTYNRLSLLKEVIAALREQSCKDFQIVVVNNGSTDETLVWLQQQKDIITITQENLGGAGGFFTGMKYVVESGYHYCWIMDDDVICEPDALQELLNAHKCKSNIGFVCSQVVGINGCLMNVPTVDERPTTNGYPDYLDLIGYQMIKVSMATFVSVLFPTEVIQKMGLPYKEFFIWGDDSEYTSRVSSKYDCYLACKSIVVHKRILQTALSFYKESDKSRLRNYFYAYRNNTYTQWKRSSWKRKMLLIIGRLLMLSKLLLEGDFLRFNILLKASISSFSFAPRIVYPHSTARE